MAGISGIVGKGAIGRLIRALAHRGPDKWGSFDESLSYGSYDELKTNKGGKLGYNLLDVCGDGIQPITDGESALVFDGRIFNYKRLRAKSEAKALFNLLKSKGFDGLKAIDGYYAFAFIPNIQEDKVWLGRDLIGIKPLWISTNGKPKFASEAKALPGETWPVLPGERLILDTKGIVERKRESLQRVEAKKRDYSELKKAIETSVAKMTRGLKRVGLLFSGGVDSTLLYLLLERRAKVKAYTCGFPDSQDVAWAKKVADEMGIDLDVTELSLERVERILPTLERQLETTNIMKIGVAFSFYMSGEKAKKDGLKVMFSGLGTEELFAGYERHLEAYKNGGLEGLNNSMWEGLETMWDRDLYRDDLATMAHSIELRVPYLDMAVVMEAMSIHPSLKLGEMKKQVLRDIAKEEGVPEFVVKRPKKAAQYGSGVDKAIRKLAKRKGMKPQAYLDWLLQNAS